MIQAKVAATNLVGPGAYSSLTDAGSAAALQTVPQAPYNFTGDQIYDTNVTVSWNALQEGAETGGSPILSYILEYKENTTSSYVTAVGGTA